MQLPDNTPGIDRANLMRVRAREDALFAVRTPGSAALQARARASMPDGVPNSWMTGLYRHPPVYVRGGDGPAFIDVDGNRYSDFNVCDLSMTLGYTCTPVAEAIAAQARRGCHYLLPTEDAVVVTEALAERVGAPYWQFTLSASQANTEIIRIARALTGRQTIVVFEGKYHGHIEETLVVRNEGAVEPEMLGLARSGGAHTVILPFNDLDAVEARLKRGDVALLLTEPALSNCTLVLPDPGYLVGLRTLTRATGTLLALDEAHTFQFAYGGLVGAWSLESDFVTLGKGLGTGVPFALYGMSTDIARRVESANYSDVSGTSLAIGGTVFANALSLAVARVALTEILTRDAYARTAELGARLAAGLQQIVEELQLPWCTSHVGGRVNLCLRPALPRSGAEGWLSMDQGLIDTRRVFLANRGYWDSIVSAGPHASFAHSVADIDGYLAATRDFLTEVCVAA